MRVLRKLFTRVRHIEAEGFYHGTQGNSPEPMVVQIEAKFEAKKAKLREKFARVLKRLDELTAVHTERKRGAETRLAEVRAETSDRRPEILAPLFWLLLGLCAVVGEVVLIAPVLDGWGIPNPNWQLFAASVIVLTASGLFDRVLRRINESRSEPVRVGKSPYGRYVPTVALAAFAVGLLVYFGFWRANEMTFAASIEGGAWGAFLAHNPTSTRVSVVLLTLELPLFAALTVDWGFRELRLGFACRRAERTIARCAEKVKRLENRREAKALVRYERLEALEDEKRETIHAYVEHHELGAILGAVKENLGWIVIRAAGLTLLLAATCFLLDPLLARHIPSAKARMILYIFAAAGVIALYLADALRRRERPTPRDLHRNRAVHWRNATTIASAAPAELPAVENVTANGGIRHDGLSA